MLLKVTRYLLVLSLNLETFLAPWEIVSSTGIRFYHFRTITVGEGSSWSMLLLGVGISGWLSSLEVGGKLLGTSNFLWLEK